METDKQYARTQDVPVKLIGEDGNVFAIIGSTSKALERAGFRDEAKAYRDACFAAGSYDEVLRITMDTVDVS